MAQMQGIDDRDTSNMDEDVDKASRSEGWDTIIQQFLYDVQMYETAQAFDYEQLVFSQHQSTLVLGAVNRLLRSLQRLESSDLSLDYSMPRGTKRRRGATDDIQYQDTPEEMQARIASTIREKRALIDQSNKEEYVKRAQLLNLSGETCARTDAVKINRRAQMKYDVVHDEDGPLARSTFDQSDTSQRNADPSIQRSRRAGDTKAARGQVLGMRCETIEDHLNVQYVPNPPTDLYRRLDYIENHIMQLEKEHPPWAAVHFRQPDRQFPPPPPVSLYNVPQSERTTLEQKVKAMMAAGPGKQSSLTRAILGKLQKQSKGT